MTTTQTPDLTSNQGTPAEGAQVPPPHRERHGKWFKGMDVIMDPRFEARKHHLEGMRREVERNRSRKSLERAGKEDVGPHRAAAGREPRRYGGRLLKLLRVVERRPKTRRSASSRVRRLLPPVLATMASQALLVVLAPTIVEVGREPGASVGAVGARWGSHRLFDPEGRGIIG